MYIYLINKYTNKKRFKKGERDNSSNLNLTHCMASEYLEYMAQVMRTTVSGLLYTAFFYM